MEEKTDWDGRFLQMADLVATWSKDPSTRVGAVIVRPNKTIASVGFNGFPRGTYDTPHLYEDREVKYSRVVHAEVNAILHATERLDGCTLYSTYPTCDRCAGVVIQAGIRRVVWPYYPPEQMERWESAIQQARRMYSETFTEVFVYGDGA
jgi:dCMP deaminase